jgi:hypothetical protein
MAHPSSIVRGKVLTVPARDLPTDSTDLELSLADAVRAVERSSQVLVSVSEGGPADVRVLIVSSSRQRSLRRWQALVSPILNAQGVHADWPKALVLQAAATHPDHG